MTARVTARVPSLIVGRRAPAIEVVPKDDPDWIPIVAARGWVVITND